MENHNRIPSSDDMTNRRVLAPLTLIDPIRKNVNNQYFKIYFGGSKRKWGVAKRSSFRGMREAHGFQIIQTVFVYKKVDKYINKHFLGHLVYGGGR